MNKWKMNRAGLLNFWYYDDEIFDFSNGKLLLRGSNGSGKSVTMQSFLPVLLDGRTSPDRLDPFGSKARRMEDYLLGEKDIVNRDERTGYLFIEFKRQETEQFLTIGIGLQAKRHKQMKFWGFVLTDNRRIGRDIQLYKTENNAGKSQKIPLSRIEWENLVGEGGQVVQTKGEYKQLVNKYLFGYETIEAYEDLIKLLIQLRSPKLSKDFRPTVIYEILEAALPPLTDEDLRHLSDTIEQMDQTKQQIEQLDREGSAIRRLNQVYSQYNEATIFEQAKGFLDTQGRYHEAEQSYQDQQVEAQQLSVTISDLTDQIRMLEIEQEAVKKQEERLRSHKIWDLAQEEKDELEKLEQQELDFDRKQGQLDVRHQKTYHIRESLKKTDESIYSHTEAIDDLLLDLQNDAEEVSFLKQHEINKQDFNRHKENKFDFTVWQNETAQHVEHIEAVMDQFRQYEDIKMRYQEKDKALAEESKARDHLTYQEQEWRKLFEEDKDKKLNEIHQWLNGAPWLDLDDSSLQEVGRHIHTLYEPTSFEVIKEPFRQAHYHYIGQQQNHLSHLRFELERLAQATTEKETELKEWQNKKDPEPLVDQLTTEARAELEKQGIAFVPFYAAVEFQDHVDDAVRRRIEAALIDSGMLNTLITEKEVEISHDRIFTVKPQTMAYTLADYLKPDLDGNNQLTDQRIDDVLRSILIDDHDSNSQLSINEQGYYQLGLIKGHALPIENVHYIGRQARIRFRQAQIDRLTSELTELAEEKSDLLEQVNQVEKQIERSDQYLATFPNDDDLQESDQQIKELRYKIEHHKKQIQVLSDELKILHGNYKQIKYQLDEQTRHDQIEFSLVAYQEANQTMKRYDKDLSKLEKQHIQYVNYLQSRAELTERLAEVEAEVVELQGELNIVEGQIELVKKNIAQIEQELEQQGVEDVRKQIEKVQASLSEIEQKLIGKREEKPRKETQLDHINQEIRAQGERVDFWLHMKEAWQDSFQSELNRGFVAFSSDESIESIAEVAISKFKESKGKDRYKLNGQLSKTFYKELTDLMEYSMTIYDAPTKVPDWMNQPVSDDQIPHIEQWKQKLTRTIIELNYQGKQVSPFTVQNEIELDQARQQSYLDDQDRALYEEILFHSVGQKLRARIRRAEQWVVQMKELMETRDISSGITFSIRWKPRTADSDEELDTIDLVHLLKQDPKLLKDEDLEKITTHFRSKIDKAKEMLEDSSELQTLLQVLKEVLDYRKWFSFVLYYQREGESKRELTNNQFFKFSGGEKALAMYIPLFTACYSRYLEAAPDAPYIISLDEAFAGVDENNIRQMFDVVEKLDFNYIMNSQVLWGDYDTVSELAISELVRPKNADYVSVIRYHWDGQKRQFVE
ncbi:TIGR02680 family protein [Amphibacillus sp. MSJ-3]|uniref:TIGR02680 family protein n=1 Tax=Amphibacillus sp. MSJ-3 TaxID=2841505 RepID=UPI001C0EC462|nr:TIGR02680 family protein [Amphibacillus sp. MSJ-3]MBU5594332.1 TIGR02680 family protein [Amphibacillus sp. MSJ-3]